MKGMDSSFQCCICCIQKIWGAERSGKRLRKTGSGRVRKLIRRGGEPTEDMSKRLLVVKSINSLQLIRQTVAVSCLPATEKLWNRMTSGSYFPPPVRTVFIPKKQGGLRPLGIPMVSDRIAEGVLKDYLEPSMEAVFYHSSFGYRPGRSAHHALGQCQSNCMQKAWVSDAAIKGFFDNINHGYHDGIARAAHAGKVGINSTWRDG